MSRKIGALWLKEGNGKKFFSGVIETLNGDVQIVIFKNDKKEKENHPDYNILLSEPKREETTAPTPEVAPDDIPF